MPNDAITLNAVVNELNGFLEGGKIEKIYQPENDEITLAIKNKGATRTLALNANPQYPCVHLTSRKKQNPLSAKPFCMLLRKHIGGGIVNNISLIDYDRIVKIEISALNEMGDRTKFYLIAELMGRYSNIILADNEYIILDAAQKVYIERNPDRPIIPGIKYIPPRQQKVSWAQKDKLSLLFIEDKEYDSAYLLQHVGGISKDTAKEIVYRNNRFPLEVINQFFDIAKTSMFKPCLGYDSKGNIKDYYMTNYLSLNYDYVYYPMLNECLNLYYSEKDAQVRKKNNTSQINKLIKSLKTKFQRRIEDCEKRIKEGGNAEIHKIYGELILCNFHKINKGADKLVCHNFYSGQSEEIPLDSSKSPQQNADLYFKKYRKLKRAKQIAQERLEELNQKLDYLKSIETAVANSDTKQEFEEIYQELTSLDNTADNINKTVKSRKKLIPSSPLYINIDGYDTYIGKNNQQNNQVTFDIGKSEDIWMHAKNFHGAHTIIKGGQIPQSVLLKAAALTAYYSEGKHSGKVDVDYTLRKNVRRAKGGLPGMVNYVNYKTVSVKPLSIKDIDNG